MDSGVPQAHVAECWRMGPYPTIAIGPSDIC
jgi:hypothetical protein